MGCSVRYVFCFYLQLNLTINLLNDQRSQEILENRERLRPILKNHFTFRPAKYSFARSSR